MSKNNTSVDNKLPTEIFDDSNTLEATELAGKCYTEYSKYVTRTRAYASVVDGMKVVYRRLLYSQRTNNHMVKSASVVGDAIKYHPHSSDAIYGALVEMTCKFGYFPLFDGHGNFGGYGQSASAMRYTECSISEIAKLMYLDLIDYAEYIDGEAGYKEPKYLPALIPYCLLVGSTSIPVGMPVPNVPVYNSLELVQYYIDLLEGNEPKLPMPDYGDVIINDTRENTNQVIKTGQGKLWFKPIIVQEDTNKFVLTTGTPNVSIDKLVDKLSWYLDNDVIDYIDETDINGSRYVFIINDTTQITPDQLKDKIDRILKCSMKCSLILEEDGIAVYCGIDYITHKGLKYLRECTVRKYKDYLIKSSYKYEVLSAIRDYRNSDKLSKIAQSTTEEVINDIVELGYSIEIAKSVLSKPTSYLTKSHDDELSKIELDISTYKDYIDNPDHYLLTLYYKLKELILERYNKVQHSIYIQDYLTSSTKYYHYDKGNNSLVIDDDDTGHRWNRVIYMVSNDGYMTAKYISSKISSVVDLSSEPHEVSQLVSDIGGRYLAIVVENKMIAVDTKDRSFSGWTKIFKEGYGQVTNLFLCDNYVDILDTKGEMYMTQLSKYVKSRVSKPVIYGRNNIVSVVSHKDNM